MPPVGILFYRPPSPKWSRLVLVTPKKLSTIELEAELDGEELAVELVSDAEDAEDHLESIEAALGRLEIADAPFERRPFLEIAVRLEGPQPGLRRHVETLLASKPVRLTRVTRAGADAAGESAPEAEVASLDPLEVFIRKHREEFDAPPGDELRAAFISLLNEAADGDAAPIAGEKAA